jgi:hypothetical protein
MISNTRTEQDLREMLKEAMAKYRISDYVMAMQLGVSLTTVRAFLSGSSTPRYVEDRVEEWLE